MKTVRFSQVVAQCGRPRVHALWVAPEKDPEFTRARKANRVMTVRPSERGKADVATVGFDGSQVQGSEFLIFPKSLQRFANARVVGVKFDLVEQPEAVAAAAATVLKPPRRHPRRDARPDTTTTTAVDSTSRETGSRETVPPPRRSRSAPARTGSPPVRQAPRPTGAVARPPKPRSTAPAHARERPGTGALEQLQHEVRTALGELRDGKTVAAYQRLERAVA